MIRKVTKGLQKNELMCIFGMEMAVYDRLFGRRILFIYEQADINYTKFSNKIFVLLFKRIDKHLISKSFNTVLTYQWFIDYIYGKDETPSNMVLLENRLNKELKTFAVKEHTYDPNAL